MNEYLSESSLSRAMGFILLLLPLLVVPIAGQAQVCTELQDTDVVIVVSGAETGVHEYPTRLAPPCPLPPPLVAAGIIPPAQVLEVSKDSDIISTEYALRRLQLVPQSQHFEYPDVLLRIRNDGAADSDFTVTFTNHDAVALGSRIPMGWRLRFCPDDGSGDCAAPIVERGPEDTSTGISISVAPGTSQDYHVQLFPRWDTLFNGGSANIIVEVNKNGGDNSQDKARFKATINRFDPPSNALCLVAGAFTPPPPPPQFTDTSITLPFFDPRTAADSIHFLGRPALMVTQSLLTNHDGNENRRLGDVKFFYADCLLSGTAAEEGLNCEQGEDPDNIDSVSLLTYAATNGGTQKTVGLGFVLSKMTPGFVNDPTDMKVRQLYYTNTGDPDTTAVKESYALQNFDRTACTTLSGAGFFDVADAPWLGTVNDCTDTVNDRTQRLISFVRGNTVPAFPRDDQRKVVAEDRFFDVGGANEAILLGTVPVDTHWLLPDLIGSPPIIIGPPNLFTSSFGSTGSSDDFERWASQTAQQYRPIVAYMMDNDGIVHAFQLATFVAGNDTPGRHYFGGVDWTFTADDDAFVRELWAYVPKGVLPNLKYTVGNDQHYFGDGLLRAIDIQMKDDQGVLKPDDFRTVLIGHQGRAGAGVFALDVTDPKNPKLFWDYACEENSAIGTTTNGPCNGGNELAVQAAPVVGKLVDTADKWVAVYGSGAPVSDFIDDYRSSESWVTIREVQGGAVVKQVRVSQTADDKKGNLLTDMIMLRDPRNGNIRALYFGDYYGAMWRVRADRLVTTVAGITSGGGLDESQDLLFKPTDYSANTVAARSDRPITARPRVAVDDFLNYWTFFGSGDYVYDLNTTGAGDFDLDDNHQRFYGLQDLLLSSSYSGTANLVDMSNQTGGAGNVNNKSWFVTLGQTVVDGAAGRTIAERVLDPGIVFGGLACFTTFQLPTNNQRCRSNGVDRLYCLDFESGRVNQATDPRLSSTSFTRSMAAPSGSPLVLVPRSGNQVPPKIVPGGPLEHIDADVNINAVDRRTCRVLLWRDRG